MRFVDVAVAATYGLFCLMMLVAIGPLPERQAAVEAADQSKLDASISSFISGVGLPFLNRGSPVALCESASAASNSTVVLDLSVEGSPCPSISVPSSPLASAYLDLSLPGRLVVIYAWLARR